MESNNLRRRAKRIAKQSVMNNLVQVMGAILVCALPFMLTSSLVSNYMLSTGRVGLPLIVYVGSIVFLVLPMFYGVISFLSELLLEGNASILQAFDSLTSLPLYLRSLRLGLCLFLRIVIWMSIPFGVTVLYIYKILSNDPTAIEDAQAVSLLLVQSVNLYSLISIPFIARVLCYLGAYPLMLRDPQLGAWQATRESARILKGHWGRMIVFFVSFFGWQLFGVWTIIGMLFYWGYLLVSFLIYFQSVEQGGISAPKQM